MIVKIQNRRGGYTDYDPSKLLPGEFAVVQVGDPNTPTGKGVYLAISAGDVVRLATTEEIAAYTQQFDDIYQSTVHDAQQILDTAKSLVSNYSGGLIVVSSTSAMTDTSSLYLYTGSGQYHNYVYAYDSSQSQFVPFFDYGIITEVDEVVAKSAYTTVLSATTYNDKATALAALDSYANTFGGSVRIVGYISTTNSVLLGLPKNTSHFMDFYVNSANYRLLVARPVSGTNIYQLAKQAGTWGSTWQTLANQTDVQKLTDLLQARQYGAMSAMYTELIALLAVNQRTWITATGDLIASLTNSEITKVCRVVVVKADTSVLDYMLFAPGSNAIYIGRINANQSVTNRNRFALTSDVTNISNRFFPLVSGTNITTSNIDTFKTSGLYLGYIESANITGSGGNSYGLLIVTAPPTSTERIGQCIIMMQTGFIATRYDMNGTWSDWQKLPTSTRVSTIETNIDTLTNKVVKTTLSTTQTSANATAETYNYQTISGLSDYAVVLVNVNCANLRQTLTFVNGDTDPQYLYEINGNNKIRGGYSVDWTNNRVGVRYLSAAGSYTYQNVNFTKVVGFIKL